MRTPILPIALTLALAAPAFAAVQPLLPFSGGSSTVRLQDDFFQGVNGDWLEHTAIPGDKKSFGNFMILREKANADVRALLEEAAAHPHAKTRLIGNFYAALTNLSAIEHEGLAPLKPAFAKLDQAKSLEDVAALFGDWLKLGVGVPVEVGVSADEKNPLLNVVYWGQGGLGLPDRDYYLKTDAASLALLDGYRSYLAELNRLAGFADADEAASRSVAFETAIAKLQWSRAERRDAIKRYNPTPRSKWDQLYPGFPWERLAKSTGMPKGMGAIVGEPSYFKGFVGLAKDTPIEAWKQYLRTRLLDSYASDLPKAFRDAHFRFKSQKLQGLTAMPPRWRTAVEETNAEVGEAIGQGYVAKHFPPQSKARMKKLVDNLLVVYRENLQHLAWMTPATRKAALAKLSKLRVKIGYPDRWRGYPGLVVKRDDAIGNLVRANRFSYERDMAEAGKPVDRSRWDMTPQTDNAYYNPVGNEIVFPAAILQPPFFDAKADDAYNYGAIGAVIGHETSHGFDDQGRHFDADGKLRDWWTAEDGKAFVARADRLVKQYDGYEPLKGEHVNGRLTLGENIADLTGVDMALQAYHYALHGKKAPIIAGWTGDQRFFLSYARVWRNKNRPEWLHQRILSDPHSPEQYRTNGVVSNLNGFYDAFGLKPGDGMYKASEDRVRIW